MNEEVVVSVSAKIFASIVTELAYALNPQVVYQESVEKMKSQALSETRFHVANALREIESLGFVDFTDIASDALLEMERLNKQ